MTLYRSSAAAHTPAPALEAQPELATPPVLATPTQYARTWIKQLKELPLHRADATLEDREQRLHFLDSADIPAEERLHLRRWVRLYHRQAQTIRAGRRGWSLLAWTGVILVTAFTLVAGWDTASVPAVQRLPGDPLLHTLTLSGTLVWQLLVTLLEWRYMIAVSFASAAACVAGGLLSELATRPLLSAPEVSAIVGAGLGAYLGLALFLLTVGYRATTSSYLARWLQRNRPTSHVIVHLIDAWRLAAGTSRVERLDGMRRRKAYWILRRLRFSMYVALPFHLAGADTPSAEERAIAAAWGGEFGRWAYRLRLADHAGRKEFAEWVQASLSRITERDWQSIKAAPVARPPWTNVIRPLVTTFTATLLLSALWRLRGSSGGATESTLAETILGIGWDILILPLGAVVLVLWNRLDPDNGVLAALEKLIKLK